jgi:hypothetical protein
MAAAPHFVGHHADADDVVRRGETGEFLVGDGHG